MTTPQTDPKETPLYQYLIPQSPFEDDFVRQELDFMEFPPEPFTKEFNARILIQHRPLQMRCDDYLNMNFRTGELNCPTFFIDREVWMSLTPMEIQSNFVPWVKAQGRVATAGLGMGYFALRAANELTVDSVDVYENNSHVIEYFQSKYAHRNEMEKINIIEGDVYKNLKDKEYDFVYMDVYQTLLPDEIIKDIYHFKNNNDIGEYRFWGQELALMNALNEGVTSPEPMDLVEHAFFRHWLDYEPHTMPLQMGDYDYFEQIAEAMGWE